MQQSNFNLDILFPVPFPCKKRHFNLLRFSILGSKQSLQYSYKPPFMHIQMKCQILLISKQNIKINPTVLIFNIRTMFCFCRSVLLKLVCTGMKYFISWISCKRLTWMRIGFKNGIFGKHSIKEVNRDMKHTWQIFMPKSITF